MWEYKIAQRVEVKKFIKEALHADTHETKSINVKMGRFSQNSF